MNNNINSLIEEVNTSAGSLFTRQDVVKLLHRVYSNEGNGSVPLKVYIDRLEYISAKLSQLWDKMDDIALDEDDLELSIENGNRVVVEYHSILNKSQCMNFSDELNSEIKSIINEAKA